MKRPSLRLVLFMSILKRIEKVLTFLREKSVNRRLIAIFRRKPLPKASKAPRMVLMRQEDSCLQKTVRYLNKSSASGMIFLSSCSIGGIGID